MRTGQPFPRPQSAPRVRLLLVLAVLVGLLGMHGTGSATPTGSGHAGPHGARHHMAVDDQRQYACHDDGTQDGHGSHADQTCAAAAVPGSVALPVLTASAPVGIDAPARPPAAALAEAAGARAPPTLAELQLLRI